MFGYKLTDKGHNLLGFLVHFILMVLLLFAFQYILLLTYYIINFSVAVSWAYVIWTTQENEESFLPWFGYVAMYMFIIPVICVIGISEWVQKAMPLLVEKDVRKKKRKNEEIRADRDDNYSYEDDLTEKYPGGGNFNTPCLEHDTFSTKRKVNDDVYTYVVNETTYNISEE